MNAGLWQRPTQTEQLIAKLREPRDQGKALELPGIMHLGIARHGARVKEIRNRGVQVVHELESVAGVLHSRHCPLFDPGRDGERK
jgi:hypothetical protein